MFFMKPSRLYFDYNATTPLAESVRDEIMRALELKNPSSSHSDGRAAAKEMAQARSKIANLIGCHPDEIIFTSGATEANNLAVGGLWESRPNETIDTIVTTSVEHDCVLRPLVRLQSKGAKVIKLKVDEKGELDLNEARKMITRQTLFVSAMLANNETGIVFPVHELAEIAHASGALLHVDAACGMGKLPFNFAKSNADLLSFSAHKFYGPKGIGALVIRKGVYLTPQILGGTHELGRRAGTENVSGILGLARALEFALEDLDTENSRLKALRDKLVASLKKIDSGLNVFENPNAQLAGTVNLSFPGLSGQLLLTSLDLEGVSVSHGSACHSGALTASRILLEMGVDKKLAEGAVRISFGRLTRDSDIDELIKIFKKVVPRIKS